jgi:hypothetical protein
LETASQTLLKTLKLFNYQGSDDLAGGGGFSPVLSHAKKKLYQDDGDIIIRLFLVVEVAENFKLVLITL